MTIPPAQAETAAFLQILSGSPPIETHISAVFIGQDTVWKLKKAVRLPFLDFTDPGDRRRFAERELELNRPAAPGLYRDVVPITRQPNGTLMLGEGSGEPADWVLRMARVPAEDFLDKVASAGKLTPQLEDEVADAVAHYHQALPPMHGVVPPMREIITGNVESSHEAGLADITVKAWGDAAAAALDLLTGWLEERAQAGFVRRTHGDLHLGNICLWNGKPVLFDALEFDESLATIDVAYDLAFLLMDLDRRVGRPTANRVLNRYVARTGDVALVRGLPLFMSLRAMVRAHVEARSGDRKAGDACLSAALAHLRTAPAVVVAVGGLPGTGKSTLARALAPLLGRAPGALVLRSDEIRKRQHSVAPEQRLPKSAYNDAATQAVFATLAAGAETAARFGQCVIADATFIDRAHRRLVEQGARAAGVPFHGFWLHAPLPELEARIAARKGDASDATIAVLRASARAKPQADAWLPVPGDSQIALDLMRKTLQDHILPC